MIFIFFNFGWPTIGVRLLHLIKQVVHPLLGLEFLRLLKNLSINLPTLRLLLFFHWNYEFELYPLPLDRELARRLSHIGVYAVVGHHSHIIQGYEFFGSMPCFYGIGNFYMPTYRFGDYMLKYPKEAMLGLCVDLSDISDIKVSIENIENNLTIKGPFNLYLMFLIYLITVLVV